MIVHTTFHDQYGKAALSRSQSKPACSTFIQLKGAHTCTAAAWRVEPASVQARIVALHVYSNIPATTVRQWS